MQNKMNNKLSDVSAQSIKSPEGVALLMKNLWLRHLAGRKQDAKNVFIVDLPPLTEEELASIRKSPADMAVSEEEENFYGGWI